jgi:hypothetical protein
LNRFNWPSVDEQTEVIGSIHNVFDGNRNRPQPISARLTTTNATMEQQALEHGLAGYVSERNPQRK